MNLFEHGIMNSIELIQTNLLNFIIFLQIWKIFQSFVSIKFFYFDAGISSLKSNSDGFGLYFFKQKMGKTRLWGKIR